GEGPAGDLSGCEHRGLDRRRRIRQRQGHAGAARSANHPAANCAFVGERSDVMALLLIKEDGTGKVDANSYASAADGDAYHDGHLYATAWAAASSGNRENANILATRLIVAEYQLNGYRAHNNQALQWPREQCPDPDKGLSTISV